MIEIDILHVSRNNDVQTRVSRVGKVNLNLNLNPHAQMCYYLLKQSQIVTHIIDTNSMVLVSFLRSLTEMHFLKFILTKLVSGTDLSAL